MTEPLSAIPITPAPATERLYWTEPQAQRFAAGVTAVRGQEVALDRTLFYPEGGGQSCDAGTLTWAGGKAQVTDVQKDGVTIWHTVEGEVPPVGASVKGALDWARRYRHSQRHSGEHLLAQAFYRVNPAFGVRSVSMRGPECTLDLAGQPGASHVRQAQELLTEILREPLSLETLLVPAAELDAYPLRRPPQVGGVVRAVLFRTASGEIWEASACGGTHLPSAVQAAPVVVVKTERVRNDLTRVTFMTGEEATERLSGTYAMAQTLARGFSVGVDRLPEKVEALQAEVQEANAVAARTRRRLATLLLQQADWKRVPSGQAALIEADDDLLSPLLEAAGERGGTVTVVVTPGGRCGVASTLPEYPAGTLLQGWLAVSGGRGGGRPELAQGQAERQDDFRGAVQSWLNALPWPE